MATGSEKGPKKGHDTPAEGGTVKVIKRYTNRKLYDTVESRYVTLDEIAAMIREGDDVRIIDNRSKEDLTSVTLAQIIFEQEKKTARMPMGMLRDLVRHGGDTLQDFISREIQPRVASIREEAETRLPKVFRRDRPPGESEETPGTERERRQRAEEMLLHFRGSVDEWQAWLDERLQTTLASFSAQALQKDLATLRARIEELRRKVAPGPAAPEDEDGSDEESSED